MNKLKNQHLVGAVLLGGFMVGGSVWAAAPAPIGDGLAAAIEAAEPGDKLPVIFTLADSVDPTTISGETPRKLRRNIILALKRHAALSQEPLLLKLRQTLAQDVTSYWIFNGVRAVVKAASVGGLAHFPGVASIKLDATVEGVEMTATSEWNISVVNAPALWDLGYAGAGVVVASMDSGVDANHQDLMNRWRGGGNSWYDPNGEHATPYDASGHGTRVTGLMVGGDAGGTAIGVAPGAQWIAAKIFNDSGEATFSGIHAAFQWMLDPDGDPLTDDAPNVVNNSWSLQNPGNCNTEFEPDIEALQASFIGVVFAAGNYGPYVSSSVSPANNPSGFSVGAVDSALAVPEFSSRGPSACDGSLYPQIAAPGVKVLTSDLTYGGVFPDMYTQATGTSFAAPHVSGAMALLTEAYPATSVAELEAAIQAAAVHVGPSGPDNDSGTGLLDIAAALDVLALSAPADTDGDGYIPPEDCNDEVETVYPGAPEIKHDGVDQDCNGYDLTIDIRLAVYGTKKDTLDVQATSALGQTAALEVVSYGAMKWNKRRDLWTLSARSVGGNPGSVEVSGLEGSESAEVSED